MRDLDDVIQLAKMIVSNLSTSRLFPIDPPLPPLTEDFNVGRAHLDKDGHGKDVLAAAIKGEYRYATLGLTLGLSSIIGGVVLGLHGVAGATSWTASFLGLQSQVNDAAPGVVLFIIGLFMIVATRPKVKFGEIKG
jgi:ABC-type microcin C transport system permease subunit YejE